MRFFLIIISFIYYYSFDAADILGYVFEEKCQTQFEMVQKFRFGGVRASYLSNAKHTIKRFFQILKNSKSKCRQNSYRTEKTYWRFEQLLLLGIRSKSKYPVFLNKVGYSGKRIKNPWTSKNEVYEATHCIERMKDNILYSCVRAQKLFLRN